MDVAQTRIQLNKSSTSRPYFTGGNFQEVLMWQVDLSTSSPLQSNLFWKRLLSFLYQYEQKLPTDSAPSTAWGDDVRAIELLRASRQEQQKQSQTLGENGGESKTRNLFQLLIQKQRWTIIDLMQAFPASLTHVFATSPKLWFALLPRLSPRYYSISSSPLVVVEGAPSLLSSSSSLEGNMKEKAQEPRPTQPPRELSVTFAVVDYLAPELLPGLAPTLSAINTANGESTQNLLDPTSQTFSHHLRRRRRRIHGIATTYLEQLATPFLLGGAAEANPEEIPQSLGGRIRK